MPTGFAWLVKGYPYMSGFVGDQNLIVKTGDVVSLSVPCVDPNIIEKTVQDHGWFDAFYAIDKNMGGCTVPPELNGLAWDRFLEERMPAWAMYYAVLLRRMGPGSSYAQWFFPAAWKESIKEHERPLEFQPGGSGRVGVVNLSLRSTNRFPGNRIWSQPLSLP
jgi:hypothetical protein